MHACLPRRARYVFCTEQVFVLDPAGTLFSACVSACAAQQRRAVHAEIPTASPLHSLTPALAAFCLRYALSTCALGSAVTQVDGDKVSGGHGPPKRARTNGLRQTQASQADILLALDKWMKAVQSSADFMDGYPSSLHAKPLVVSLRPQWNAKRCVAADSHLKCTRFARQRGEF